MSKFEEELINSIPVVNNVLREYVDNFDELQRELDFEDIKLIVRYRLNLFVDIINKRFKEVDKYPQIIEILLKKRKPGVVTMSGVGAVSRVSEDTANYKEEKTKTEQLTNHFN